MTMREKIARAMYHAMILRSPYVILDAKDVTLTAHAWEHQSDKLRADWLAVTDSCLDALLEPTHEMYLHGMMPDTVTSPPNSNCVDVFKRMIRAARAGK